MSFLANRSKPFRSAQAKPIKEAAYRLSSLSTPPVYANGIAANESFVAVGYGSSKGSVVLLPTVPGQYKPTSTPFTISAHASDIGDLAWNPFTPNQLATGSADGTVKLWSVPAEGLTANLNTPAAKFDGLETVHSLAFHPSASGILAAGHKTGVSILDLESATVKFSASVSGFGRDVVSTNWNRSGSLLSTVSKNASLALFDPRAGDESVLSSATAPNALIKKLQHGLFIGGDGSPEFLLLCGVSSAQRPVMAWVDPRNPSVAVKTHDFDFSQGYALPLYDRDTSTLYYTIRGSEVVSLLDVECDKNAPSIWPSHTFAANAPVKGMCLLPKRAANTNACEVNRIFTLGSDSVEAYAVTVPRKTAGFHAELFPDTADNRAAQTGAEWAAGGNKDPLKTSMVAIHEAGGVSASTTAATAAGLVAATARLSVAPTEAAPTAAVTSPTTTVSPTATRPSAGSVSVAAARDRGASQAPAATYVPSNTRTAIDSILKKSVFTHCTGREPPSQFQSYFDLKLGSSLSLAENIQANRTFFAVPWQASGGSAIAVFRLAPTALGRCPPTQFCVRGHKSPATSFDLSSFDQCQLASGSVEGHIFVWRIPSGGLTADLQQPESQLNAGGKVTLVRYHPYVRDLLVSCSSTFDGHVIELWDVSNTAANQESPAVTINLHAEPIIDIAFHPRSHLLATTSRDGKTRVIHIASQKVVREFVPPESVKDTRVVWIDNDRLLTVGFGSGGQRSMSLFDTSVETPKLLQTVELDRVSYLALPRYDPSTRLLYLANAGGTLIPLFQLHTQSPYIEQLNMFQTSTDTVGFVLLEKRSVDVAKVEVQRALKLTKDAVLPITYSVPRKRTEFFQDDLFPPTRVEESEMTVAEFLAGTFADGKDQTLSSLQPAGMTPLSSAPEEEITERQAKYQSKLAADAAPKPVGALGHTDAAQVREHFIALQGNVGGANRWDAKVDNSREDVDDSEWD